MTTWETLICESCEEEMKEQGKIGEQTRHVCPKCGYSVRLSFEEDYDTH